MALPRIPSKNEAQPYRVVGNEFDPEFFQELICVTGILESGVFTKNEREGTIGNILVLTILSQYDIV